MVKQDILVQQAEIAQQEKMFLLVKIILLDVVGSPLKMVQQVILAQWLELCNQ